MIPLYRSDPYLSEFKTTIDRVIPYEDNQAVFCREALFMEGGGQPMDHGTINFEDASYPLLKIIKEKGNTGYVISPNAQIKKGCEVTCTLDFERRYSIMRLHSAQHALAGALRSVRESILTGGMKIADDALSCAVFYPESSALTDNDLTNSMKVVADVIKKDLTISTLTVTSEAEAIEQFGTIYRPTIASGSLKGSIRLVLIDGLDANACGGTHVKSLSEIKAISIQSVSKQDDGTWLTFAI